MTTAIKTTINQKQIAGSLIENIKLKLAPNYGEFYSGLGEINTAEAGSVDNHFFLTRKKASPDILQINWHMGNNLEINLYDSKYEPVVLSVMNDVPKGIFDEVILTKNYSNSAPISNEVPKSKLLRFLRNF
jgi:hypothetical protein